jgi:putative transposase
VPTSEGGEQRGYDGGKKVRGRKRHIAVDTCGFLLALVVTGAQVDDGRAAPRVVEQLPREAFPRLEVLYADQKFDNYELDYWLHANSVIKVVVQRREDSDPTFKPAKIRWVVERTFAWLKRNRWIECRSRENHPFERNDGLPGADATPAQSYLSD